jgi:hypothetical protein
MKIRGRIMLVSPNNITSSVRIYNSKTERTRIIRMWQKLYGIKRNSKKYFIVIEPELVKNKLIEKGEVFFYNENDVCLEESKYTNIAYREKIIEHWAEKHNLKRFYTHIKPYYED